MPLILCCRGLVTIAFIMTFLCGQVCKLAFGPWNGDLHLVVAGSSELGKDSYETEGSWNSDLDHRIPTRSRPQPYLAERGANTVVAELEQQPSEAGASVIMWQGCPESESKGRGGGGQAGNQVTSGPEGAPSAG